MESWEREYERIILEEKKRKEKAKRKKRKAKNYNDYYNACWEEISRADGTKYYKPNNKKINVIRKKERFWNVFKRLIKRVVKICLAIIVLFVVLLFIIISLSKFDSRESAVTPAIGFTETIRMPRTYIDGIKFSEMVNVLKKISGKDDRTVGLCQKKEECFGISRNQ